MEILGRIAAFIGEMDFAVLSTLSPGGPWISLMSYLPGADGLTVCLAMATGSYKARLIRENPNVALLIDNRCRHDDPGRVTALSIYGTAAHVADHAASGQIVATFRRRRPHLAAFLDRPDTGIVRITPGSFQVFDGVDKGEFLKHGEAGWHYA